MINYLIAMTTQAGIYALLGLSLNLQAGYTGLINFGLVGFFAVGAYAYGIATTTLGWPPLPAFALAMAVGAAVAYPLGLASIRLRLGFYLAIVTLGFSEVIRAVLVNETWLTNGTRGLAVTRFFPGLGQTGSQVAMLVLVLALVAVVYVAFERIGRSPFGRTIEAIRDNEDAARSLGKPVAGFKVEVFMIGAAVAAGAGALNAVYVNYLIPDQFVPLITFYIWMAMIIGGSGSNRGVILGSVVLAFFLEGSRFIKDVLPIGNLLDDSRLASLRFMVVGLALILIPMYWPRGLWGRKEF